MGDLEDRENAILPYAKSTTHSDDDTLDDDPFVRVNSDILENNKEGLIDNPLLHLKPNEADEAARQFAREYGFVHLEQLFVKAGRILRDPETWENVNDLTLEDREVVKRANEAGFREQPKELRVTIITLCIAAIIQGWNQTGSNGANLNWPEEFGLHVNRSDRTANAHDIWVFAIVNAATYLSASLVGCWLSDPLNEYFFGRRAAIFVSGVFVLASVIGGACTHSWQQLLACRVLLGIGMGAKASCVPVYAAEIAPSHIRGSLVMNWQLFDALGLFLGFTANLVVSQLGHLAWRFQTASAFLPTIVMLALIFVCPESPRFYIKRGGQKHYAEAYKSLLYLRGEPLLAAKELFYVHSQIKVEKELLSLKKPDEERHIHNEERHGQPLFQAVEHPSIRVETGTEKQGGTDSIRQTISGLSKKRSEVVAAEGLAENEGRQLQARVSHPSTHESPRQGRILWKAFWQRVNGPSSRSINYWQKLGQLFTKPRVRRATVSAAVCMICQQICGVNVLAFYSTTLFRDAAQDSLKALWLSWGIGLTNFVFGIPAYWLIDRFGRRFLLLVTTPALAVTMLAAALSFEIPIQSSAHVPVISFFFFLFMAIYSVGMGPVPFTLSAEVFPLESRVVGMSYAVFLNLAGAGILTLVVPALTDALGQTRILCIFAALNVVAFILIFLFVRETAGATVGRSLGNQNYISLEELNYIFGVPNLAHIKYQVKTVLPWFFHRYILCGGTSLKYPRRPAQLYRWALDVEKTKREKRKARKESQERKEKERERMMQEAQQENIEEEGAEEVEESQG